jgi:hypothetical protein
MGRKSIGKIFGKRIANSLFRRGETRADRAFAASKSA